MVCQFGQIGVHNTLICPNWHTMGVLYTLYFLECNGNTGNVGNTGNADNVGNIGIARGGHGRAFALPSLNFALPSQKSLKIYNLL